MALRVLNTMTRRKERFQPRQGTQVQMFVCGQTPYDDAHVGHAKTYIQFDIMVRWLQYLGYTVFYAQNITDVDDKIILRAQERGVEALSLAKVYITRFLEDMEALHVRQNVTVFPTTSNYIPHMVEQILTLIEKGHAYRVDGDVYYDVTTFSDYTQLSHTSLDDVTKHRIEPDPRKRNSFDFALWKHCKPGEVAWDSPWGKGRPGWHIEDTAMAVSLFGPQYDVHGGANELIFPHHTNEIAQAEAATGKKPFVNYWIHTGVLTIRGEKMSKSLHNFLTIREVLRRYDPEVLRLYFAATHYRKPIAFTEHDLHRSQTELEYLYNTLRNITYATSSDGAAFPEVESLLAATKRNFEAVMNDDFNTPQALMHLYTLARRLNARVSTQQIRPDLTEKITRLFHELGQILGILEKDVVVDDQLPDPVKQLLQQREVARKRKDWDRADQLRDEITNLGYLIEDTLHGTRWRKLRPST